MADNGGPVGKAPVVITPHELPFEKNSSWTTLHSESLHPAWRMASVWHARPRPRLQGGHWEPFAGRKNPRSSGTTKTEIGEHIQPRFSLKRVLGPERVVGDLMLQPGDTMSLRTADLGSVCVRARSSGLTQTPQQSHPLSPLHEPLHGELNATRKQKMLSLQSFLREGRVVGLC